MGSVRRSFSLAFLFLWILTTGSTCQSSIEGGHFQAQGSGLAVIAVVLVAAGVSCLADSEICGGREPTASDQAQLDFETGLSRLKKGDSSGLSWICLAGLHGNARAQYFYGVYLLRRNPANPAASLVWLRRAAAQDHKAAGFVLRQMTAGTKDSSAGSAAQPTGIAPPALRACATGAAAGGPAGVMDAWLRQPSLPG